MLQPGLVDSHAAYLLSVKEPVIVVCVCVYYCALFLFYELLNTCQVFMLYRTVKEKGSLPELVKALWQQGGTVLKS